MEDNTPQAGDIPTTIGIEHQAVRARIPFSQFLWKILKRTDT